MPTLLALDRVLSRQAAETLGRYQLLGRLGAGGMAEVFVARCGELPGMQSLLAIKRILPHLADDERFVALFRREAQISLRLRHRAIARVFEVGCAGPAWFLAMELVAGESLSHLLRAEAEQGRAVDPRMVAWVGAEIASALHHAHSLTDGAAPLEVIHRDVSPQNLLLGFDGAAKLIDFGVARCVRLSDATRTGTVRGKLAYASPEQLGARPLDGRSDLFSLAAVLHEWLVGRPLFARDSDAATVQAVQATLIPPLPQAPRLGQVLARALERDPERRFPDGDSLSEALLDAVGGRPSSPERLVAAHLAALFPDRKLRWEAITAGDEPGGVGLEPARTTGGGTVRGTPLSSLGSLAESVESAPGRFAAMTSTTGEAAPASPTGGPGTLARVRARWRWALAGAAAAALVATLLVSAGRHHPAQGPATNLSLATPPSAAVIPIVAAEVAPLPPPAVPEIEAAAPAPPPVGSRNPRRLSPHARRSDRHRRAPVAPAAPSTNVASPPPAARRAIVNELERSPYTMPR